VLACWLVGWSIDARASFPVPPPVLNPKNCFSTSGKYALFVNPSDLYGRGTAAYRLSLDGREVWSATKQYTLWDAGVTNEGLVAGYAYSNGYRGFSRVGQKGGLGDFRVVIIDRLGKELHDEATKREFSHYPECPPNPVANGLIMDAAIDRLVVRIADGDINRHVETWQSYQLSTGKALATFRPKELMADASTVRYVMGVKPVPDTSLFVVHWLRSDRPRMVLVLPSSTRTERSFGLSTSRRTITPAAMRKPSYDCGSRCTRAEEPSPATRTGSSSCGSRPTPSASRFRSPAGRAAIGPFRKLAADRSSKWHLPRRNRPRSRSSHFNREGTLF
jgi:hypothetical protein